MCFHVRYTAMQAGKKRSKKHSLILQQRGCQEAVSATNCFLLQALSVPLVVDGSPRSHK